MPVKGSDSMKMSINSNPSLLRRLSHIAQPRSLLCALAIAALVSAVSALANECTNLPVRPVYHTVLPGQSASFTVSELVAPLEAIQWYRADEPLPEATNATLALTNIQIAQA